jgi:small subunit ribosomal protein S8
MSSNIATILKEEGFIQDFEAISEGKDKALLLSLKYTGKKRTPIITTLKRVSKPGVRVYMGAKNLPRILGNLGIAIISTSQGLMTDAQARKMKVGGEVLCYIW